ncbi:porphobilinogen synthase [bacterium]|nr:porphobilinogen synthase [bacterium]MBU1917769.1 porphobilinogen synthase [bacterium]
MTFPLTRSRRLRNNDTLRRLVRETTLTINDLIMPIFLVFGKNKVEPISSMPGINRYSLDRVGEHIAELNKLNIPGVILFGIPEHKDAQGSGAYADDGIIQEGIKRIKDQAPDLLVIADLCLCEYTSHGHCGMIKGDQILNDESLDVLARAGVSQAKAGADIIAPSDMMDGRVLAVRSALDETGFSQTPILSYAAKYASSFYGPFREAADGAPQFGDRKTYQMDPGNAREAIKEVLQDIDEGADMIMVKPALPYLDIIAKTREVTDLPVGAYNVSGEYAMIMAAAEKGWLDKDKTILESVTSIKRAGADFIITYFAEYLAKNLL